MAIGAALLTLGCTNALSPPLKPGKHAPNEHGGRAMACPVTELNAWFNQMPGMMEPGAPRAETRDNTPHGRLIVVATVGQQDRYGLVEREFSNGVLTLDIGADPSASGGQARFEGFMPLDGVKEVRLQCGTGPALSVTNIEKVY